MTVEEAHHDEVLAALQQAAREQGATPDLGARIQADRRTRFSHLGLRTPLRRARVKQGFDFLSGSEADVLRTWDRIWWAADVGDVLFAPLDHYRTVAVEHPEALWATSSRWIERIDNWAHADDLARVYSRTLEAVPDVVYPTLLRWSGTSDPWLQRISMVSLIRYSGANASFMPTTMVLEVVENCVDDQRDTVAKALGWVLRETMRSDESAVLAFVDRHGPGMAPEAKRRAMRGITRT